MYTIPMAMSLTGIHMRSGILSIQYDCGILITLMPIYIPRDILSLTSFPLSVVLME